MKKMVYLLIITLAVFLNACGIPKLTQGKAGEDQTKPQAQLGQSDAAVKYDDFKAMTPDKQKEVFSKLNGQEIYDLVASSDENWPVTAYDLISPENAKETIILMDIDQ